MILSDFVSFMHRDNETQAFSIQTGKQVVIKGIDVYQ